MKLSLKNSVSCAVLLIGMLVCMNTFFQKLTSSSLTELTPIENTNIDSNDLDFLELNQMFASAGLLLVTKQFISHNHFYNSTSSTRPFLSVWLPPKLVL